MSLGELPTDNTSTTVLYPIKYNTYSVEVGWQNLYIDYIELCYILFVVHETLVPRQHYMHSLIGSFIHEHVGGKLYFYYTYREEKKANMANFGSPSSSERSGVFKHVSFQERIDLVAVDGTVDSAYLSESNDLVGYFNTSEQLGFDFRSCSIHDHEGEEEEDDDESHHVSSYKKLLPRSSLPYLKRE